MLWFAVLMYAGNDFGIIQRFLVLTQISTSVPRTTEAVTTTQLVSTMTEVSHVRATQDSPETGSPALVG